MANNGQHFDDYDILEVRAMARDAGLDLSLPSVQKTIQARRRRAQDLAPPEPPRIYTTIQNTIAAVGNLLTTAIMLLIAHMILPLSVLGLAYAEMARVSDGISMFDPARADILAIVAVIFYLGLLVVYSDKVAGQEIQRDKWSLRLSLRKLKYTFSPFGKFRAQHITTLDLLEKSILWLERLIILLGTTGSLQNEINVANEEGDPVAWYVALSKLITESELPVFLSLLGGLVLTAGLLFGLRFVIDYLWRSFRSLLPENTGGFFTESSADSVAADMAEMEYLLARIRKQKQV